MDSSRSGRDSPSSSACNSEDAYWPMDSLFAAKRNRRRQLAALPFEEKIRLVVELQRIAAEVARASGRTTPGVWRISD